MMMATRSDTWQDTCDFLSFRLHTSRQQHLEAPTSDFPSRVPNGGAPVEAPPPVFSKSCIARSASFACSWLICGLLRSPAPCTRPQPCSPYSQAPRQVVGQDAYALNGER
jgi:hypothetical protein